MADRSIVEFRASRPGYRCGYCGSPDTKFSQGMWAHAMTVQDYQDLIDRGWRRSGKYCYKPIMNKTCCPQYAIRHEALKFKLNKSHKKVIKRMNNYLNSDVRIDKNKLRPAEEGGEHPGEGSSGCDVPADRLTDGGTSSLAQDVASGNVLDAPSQSQQSVEEAAKGGSDSQGSSTRGTAAPSSESSANKQTDTNSQPPVKIQRKPPRPGEGKDPNRPDCKKAKVLRLERYQQKHGSLPDKPKAAPQAKSLDDFLNEVAADPKHKFELRLVRSNPRSPEFNATFDASYNVYKRYQMAIHNDPEDKVNERQYTRFLVESPLEEEYHDGGIAEGYGSFHQQYWLDGKLIAVGVLDILPTCVSSVYVYYDPDYFFLTIGTYSALREIKLVRELHQREKRIQYYYMGYYIHSCPKMKYKGQYIPSYLACPETYKWQPIEYCRPKLDANKYSRFAPEGEIDEDRPRSLSQVLILHKRTLLMYMQYQAIRKRDDEDEVRQYAELTGLKVAESMLLFRS